jgi:putative alpha-1,2-mannosidase
VHEFWHGTTQYTSFSGWDIYRSEVPPLAMLAPTQTSQMMQSLVNDAQQGGWLPKWPVANGYIGVMDGDSTDAILAEAYAFGARTLVSWSESGDALAWRRAGWRAHDWARRGYGGFVVAVA